MAAGAFFEDGSKKRAAEAVKAVEAKTSAEVVIAVRRTSGDYRAADYLFGIACGTVVVLVLYFLPQAFDPRTMPVDGVLATLIGVLASANLPPLRRALVLAKTRAERVGTAARAAFYDLGISKTQARNGILVFVSVFERKACVVPDVGIDPAKIDGWRGVVEAIEAAVERLDFGGFVAAVEKLGPVLAPTMPRAADDVNELPDEVA
jgi:putative membrane protein